jgi:hypothetical protein
VRARTNREVNVDPYVTRSSRQRASELGQREQLQQFDGVHIAGGARPIYELA